MLDWFLVDAHQSATVWGGQCLLGTHMSVPFCHTNSENRVQSKLEGLGSKWSYLEALNFRVIPGSEAFGVQTEGS